MRDQEQEMSSRNLGEVVSEIVPRCERRGMAELGNMLTQQPGGKPFVFDNGPIYHQFVIGPSGSGMLHAAAAERVKFNCKMFTKLHIVPSGQEL